MKTEALTSKDVEVCIASLKENGVGGLKENGVGGLKENGVGGKPEVLILPIYDWNLPNVIIRAQGDTVTREEFKKRYGYDFYS